MEIPVARSGYDLVNGGQLESVEVLTLRPSPMMDAQTAKVKRVFSSRDFPLDPVPVLDVNEAGVRCMAYVDAPSRDFRLRGAQRDGARWLAASRASPRWAGLGADGAGGGDDSGR